MEAYTYGVNPHLGGFIKFLEDHGLVKFNILGKGEEQFINRLKLQKYTLLAMNLGMPFPYQYAIYTYGPYSRDLAADYHALARNGQYGECMSSTPDEFRKDDFLKAVHNDPKWLETAATIIDINGDVEERAALMKEVHHIKFMFDRKFIAGVLDDLEAHGLITVRA